MKKGIYLKKGEVKILMRATNYNEVMLAIEEIKRKREIKKKIKEQIKTWKAYRLNSSESLIDFLEKEDLKEILKGTNLRLKQ